MIFFCPSPILINKVYLTTLAVQVRMFFLCSGVPARPSGFPLYLFRLRFRSAVKGCRSNP